MVHVGLVLHTIVCGGGEGLRRFFREDVVNEAVRVFVFEVRVARDPFHLDLITIQICEGR